MPKENEPKGMTYREADAALSAAKEALAYAKAQKAPRQVIKDLQKKVSNAQAVRNLF